MKPWHFKQCMIDALSSCHHEYPLPAPAPQRGPCEESLHRFYPVTLALSSGLCGSAQAVHDDRDAAREESPAEDRDAEGQVCAGAPARMTLIEEVMHPALHHQHG